MAVLPLPFALEEVGPLPADTGIAACRAGRRGGGGPVVVALDSLSDRLIVLALDRSGNGGGPVAGAGVGARAVSS